MQGFDDKKRGLIAHTIRLDRAIVDNIEEELRLAYDVVAISVDDIVEFHTTRYLETLKALFNIPQSLIDEITYDETR